jgi:hypothetical protein
LKARGASQPGKLGRKMRAVICGQAEVSAEAATGAGAAASML